MVELKRVGVLSTAKMFAVLSLIGGIVIAVFAVAILSLMPAVAFNALAQYHFVRLFIGLGALLLVVIPILMLVLGFVVGGFESWLYNLIARKVGGAKLVLTKGVVRSFDLVSTARMVALIAGVVTLIAFIIMALFDVLASAGLGVLATLGLGILETIFVMIIEFVVFIILGAIYNYAARKIGGVRVDIKNSVLKGIEPAPFAKIYGIFAAILGLFYGLLFTLIFAVVPATNMQMHLFGIIGAFSIVLFPIIGFVLGFIYAAVYAIVYNWVATKMGGIKVYLS